MLGKYHWKKNKDISYNIYKLIDHDIRKNRREHRNGKYGIIQYIRFKNVAYKEMDEVFGDGTVKRLYGTIAGLYKYMW